MIKNTNELITLYEQVEELILNTLRKPLIQKQQKRYNEIFKKMPAKFETFCKSKQGLTIPKSFVKEIKTKYNVKDKDIYANLKIADDNNDDFAVKDLYESAKIRRNHEEESYWKRNLYFSEVFDKETEQSFFRYLRLVEKEIVNRIKTNPNYLKIHRPKTNSFIHIDAWKPEVIESFDKKTLGELEVLFDCFAKLRNYIFNCNLRLVDKEVTKKRFKKQEIENRFLSIFKDEFDYRSYGWKGLMHSIQKFDPERNLKFSTYATSWINQSMDEGINRDDPDMRFPANYQMRINNFNKELKALTEKSENGIVDDKKLAALKKKWNLEVDFKNWRNYWTSLESEIANCKDQDKSKWEPHYEFKQLDNIENIKLIDDTIKKLGFTKLEAEVFKLRNGLFPYIKHNSKEITKILNIENKLLAQIDTNIKKRIERFKNEQRTKGNNQA